MLLILEHLILYIHTNGIKTYTRNWRLVSDHICDDVLFTSLVIYDQIKIINKNWTRQYIEIVGYKYNYSQLLDEATHDCE